MAPSGELPQSPGRGATAATYRTKDDTMKTKHFAAAAALLVALLGAALLPDTLDVAADVISAARDQRTSRP